MAVTRRLLEDMFAAMRGALGPSCWWPADSDFEVMVGAVLTQNTAWGNVEKAVTALREAGKLSPRAMQTSNYKRPGAGLPALLAASSSRAWRTCSISAGPGSLPSRTSDRCFIASVRA